MPLTYDWPYGLLGPFQKKYPNPRHAPYQGGMISETVPAPYDPNWYEKQNSGTVEVDAERDPFNGLPMAWSMGGNNLWENRRTMPDPVGDSLSRDTWQGSMLAEYPSFGMQNGLLGNGQVYPQVTPETFQNGPTAPGNTPNDWPAEAFNYKPPQNKGGLFGSFNNNMLPLIQAGLGIMAAGGWNKMPVSFLQAVGQGAMPAVGTQMEISKWNDQKEMRQQALEDARMRTQAYADQIGIQRDAMMKRQGFYKQYQDAVKAGDTAAADQAIRSMVALDKPESLLPNPTKQTDGLKTEVIDGRVKQWNPQTSRYDIDLGKAPDKGPLASVTVGVNSYAKEEGKNIANRMDAIQNAAISATGDIQRYDRLGNLLGQVSTGKFKGSTLELKAAAKGLGFDLSSFGISDDVAPAQAARALSRALALELRNPAGGAGMPGALSDSDRQYLESMIPNIESDPKAWPQMIEAYKQLKKREIEVARLAREYTKRSGKNGQLDWDFISELEDYSKKNPLFQHLNDKKPSIKDKYEGLE